MSCGLTIAAALMLSEPGAAMTAPASPPPAAAPASVAAEPLFAEIIARSSALKAMVDGWAAGAVPAEPELARFRTATEELAALDMQGHLVLKERGTDGDLKCILRGISEDMPKKVEAVTTAVSPQERALALSELAYLLNDNVEVITAPPQPEA
jgi:hypothetical protein